MFLSSDPGAAASGSRRGRSAGARRTGVRAARGGAAARRRGARLEAAPRALRLAIRFELAAVDRFVDLFFDAFLLDDLRDFAAVFVVFRRFLAMRAPPVECARILSDKLIARVPILRSFLLFLLLVSARPVFADQYGAVPAAGELRMPFQRGTVEISVIGGVTLPVSLFRAKSDHQIAMASVAFGRVMAGGPGRGNFELLVEATPFFHVRQPDLVRGWSVAPLFLRWNFPPPGPPRRPHICRREQQPALHDAARSGSNDGVQLHGAGGVRRQVRGRAPPRMARRVPLSTHLKQGTDDAQSGGQLQFPLSGPQFSPLAQSHGSVRPGRSSDISVAHPGRLAPPTARRVTLRPAITSTAVSPSWWNRTRLSQ